MKPFNDFNEPLCLDAGEDDMEHEEFSWRGIGISFAFTPFKWALYIEKEWPEYIQISVGPFLCTFGGCCN